MADTPKGGRQRKRKGSNKENGHNFLVVGIGASAGGYKALERFFERMQPDSQMAFVVILHLSPEHESHLASLLQRKTSMPVLQVKDQIKVQPNTVYVIPPGKHLAMVDGHIRLIKPEAQKGIRVPIDLFFRTLAEAYSTHSIGVILSGTGTDGTLGLRGIKERGGVSIAQEPLEAEYDGMPRSVINAGLADFVLPVDEIPDKLITLRKTTESLQIWPEGDRLPEEVDETALRGILTFLRIRTNHDFSNYKQSTVLRRIARRLQVNHLQEIKDYQQFLRDHPAETQALLKDMLISVTNFFRDHEAFQALEQQVVPQIFADKEYADPVRVWVAGCATGEEAYSLAMLLLEYTERLELPPNIQIFATDIDEERIAEAREGVYPDSIEADVTPERLKRFFTKDEHHYRIKKEVREAVLFAPHNVLRDPPFSKLDMISCRNLLIYLNRETQDRVLEIFHFALRPNGYLFLGASESAETLTNFYTPFDKKHRIYRCNNLRSGQVFWPHMPIAQRWDRKVPEPLPVDKKIASYGELHQALLEQYAPPSILVNRDYEILHLSESAGRFLRLTGGEPSHNLFKAVHPDLRLDLRAAIFAATQNNQESTIRNVRTSLEGKPHLIDIVIRQGEDPESARGFLLVSFEETPLPVELAAPAEAPADTPVNPIEAVVRQLEEELQRTKEQLRATIEQYETSTEELKASNEELQAINEELRSTSEELETSKEELQSLNEELITVNHELKDKVEEVSRFNSDLQNLMAATDIGTIFLDRQLRIKRFTPRMQELFNIIPGDLDRPFSHLTNKLTYNKLPDDARQVLETLLPIEREVQSTDGRYFILRLLPYQTVDNKIDGVVLTFMDNTDRKHAEAKVKKSEARFHLLVESVEDYAIFSLDHKGYIKSWSAGATNIFGYSESEAIGQSVEMMFTPENSGKQMVEKEMQRALKKGRVEDESWYLRKDGSRFYANGVMTPLLDSDSGDFVKILRDLTARQLAEEQLRRSHENLEEQVKVRTVELQNANLSLQSEVAEHHAAQNQVKELMRHIVSTQELERQRISRDVHDILGQQLTALRLNLESLKEQVTGQAELREKVEQAQTLAKGLDSEVDFLAWELRPAALAELGLVAALEGFIQDWSKHFGIAADFHPTGVASVHLTPELEINLYRITQEALNNVLKHAEANRVDLILEQQNHNLVLVIEDDGKGFDATERLDSESGIGLVSMRERASLLGGTLEVESTPGEGTTIFARIPIQSGNGKEKR